jgi:hypothetical protein
MTSSFFRDSPLTSCQWGFLLRIKVIALDTGTDDCLTKPFAFQELLAGVRALLRRWAEPDFTADREIVDALTGEVTLPADFSELGILLVMVTYLSLLLPMVTILLIQKSR